jgi:hypothetical protein
MDATEATLVRMMSMAQKPGACCICGATRSPLPHRLQFAYQFDYRGSVPSCLGSRSQWPQEPLNKVSDFCQRSKIARVARRCKRSSTIFNTRNNTAADSSSKATNKRAAPLPCSTFQIGYSCRTRRVLMTTRSLVDRVLAPLFFDIAYIPTFRQSAIAHAMMAPITSTILSRSQHVDTPQRPVAHKSASHFRLNPNNCRYTMRVIVFLADDISGHHKSKV